MNVVACKEREGEMAAAAAVSGLMKTFFDTHLKYAKIVALIIEKNTLCHIIFDVVFINKCN